MLSRENQAYSAVTGVSIYMGYNLTKCDVKMAGYWPIYPLFKHDKV